MPNALGKMISRIQDLSDWPTTPDARYVNVAGDTMTGQLAVTGAVAPTALGVDSVRIGVVGGTPRIYFEDSAAAIQWAIDNIAGTFRLQTDVGGVFLSLTSAGDLSVVGGIQSGGNVGTAWAFLTYTNGGGTTWTDYGGAYQFGRYKKLGDLVMLAGLCKRTAGSGTTIATLPSGFRPARREMFVALADTGIAQVDVLTDGTIVLVSGGAGFVQLNFPPFSTL